MPDSLSTLFSLPSLLGNHNLGDIASRVGEPEQSVRRGLESIVPALLNGLVNKAGEPGAMREVVDLASKTPPDAPISAGNSLDANSPLRSGGKRLVSTLLGANESSAVNAAGASSGLRSNTLSTLMSLAGGLVLGAIGKRVREGGFTATSLAELLQREGPAIRQSFPTGTTDRTAGGRPIVTERIDRDPVVAEAVIKEKRSSNLWLWLIPLALILLGLVWYLLHGRTPAGTETHAPAAAAVTATSLGDFVKRKLPDNVELSVPERGVESRLLAFIQDPAKPADKTTWFDFDRLVFDTAQTTLRPESREQLKNVAAILKAYPNVHIKVGGYTDSTGDAQQNQKLSQGRAESVVAELTRMGIGADRMEAQGYGEEHPVGDNSTEAGRAQNRRVSMLVTQK